MAPSLLDTFRVLSSFDPPRQSLEAAPWEAYVDWAIAQGVAPLAAYNLEYRLAGAGAPEWARDRLLSIYQGSVNDNVMKLVNFKRTVDDLEGRRILVLGGASFAESLYPHVAFRPVLDIELVVRAGEVERFAHFLGQNEFRPAPPEHPHPGGPRQVLSDGRTNILLFAELLGPSFRAQEDELFARALPMPVYGSSTFCPDLEDAVLVVCLSLARHGFEVPALWYLDLRELLLGAPSTGGAYSRRVDFEALKARAKALRLERALYAAAAVVQKLFPQTGDVAALAKPSLGAASRRLLDSWVVEPVAKLGNARVVRGTDRLRRLLVGGRR